MHCSFHVYMENPYDIRKVNGHAKNQIKSRKKEKRKCE